MYLKPYEVVAINRKVIIIIAAVISILNKTGEISVPSSFNFKF